MQLLAFARIHLGMQRSEFMKISPRYFEELVEQYRLSRERNERGRDFMLSQIAAEIANSHSMPRYEAWRQPVEFLPTWQKKDERKKAIRKRRSREDIADEIRETMAAFGMK
jgi:hypothetical protein